MNLKKEYETLLLYVDYYENNQRRLQGARRLSFTFNTKLDELIAFMESIIKNGGDEVSQLDRFKRDSGMEKIQAVLHAMTYDSNENASELSNPDSPYRFTAIEKYLQDLEIKMRQYYQPTKAPEFLKTSQSMSTAKMAMSLSSQGGGTSVTMSGVSARKPPEDHTIDNTFAAISRALLNPALLSQIQKKHVFEGKKIKINNQSFHISNDLAEIIKLLQKIDPTGAIVIEKEDCLYKMQTISQSWLETKSHKRVSSASSELASVTSAADRAKVILEKADKVKPEHLIHAYLFSAVDAMNNPDNKKLEIIMSKLQALSAGSPRQPTEDAGVSMAAHRHRLK